MSKKRKNKLSEKKPKPKVGKTLMRFYILFGGLIIIITVLFPVANNLFEEPLTKLMFFTASLTGGFLKTLGGSVSVSGTSIISSHFSVKVVYECLGIAEMLYFAAAVIAFPSDFKKKLLGILIFSPVIFVTNILRCALLVVAGDRSIDTFNFVHIYFFQATRILFIAILWLIWIKKVVRYEGKSA